MDIVRKIIRAYLYNPMPEKVQRQFRSWCLREEGSHEKTEALREEWERLDPAAVLPTDEEAYRGKLARLHGEMRPPLRLRTIPLSRRAAAVAAAVVVLAMSVEFFVVRHLTADSTTVLVTAENSAHGPVFGFGNCERIVPAQRQTGQQLHCRCESDQQQHRRYDGFDERGRAQPSARGPFYSTHTASFLRTASAPPYHSGCAVAGFSSSVRS